MLRSLSLVASLALVAAPAQAAPHRFFASYTSQMGLGSVYLSHDRCPNASWLDGYAEIRLPSDEILLACWKSTPELSMRGLIAVCTDVSENYGADCRPFRKVAFHGR